MLWLLYAILATGGLPAVVAVQSAAAGSIPNAADTFLEHDTNLFEIEKHYEFIAEGHYPVIKVEPIAEGHYPVLKVDTCFKDLADDAVQLYELRNASISFLYVDNTFFAGAKMAEQIGSRKENNEKQNDYLLKTDWKIMRTKRSSSTSNVLMS